MLFRLARDPPPPAGTSDAPRPVARRLKVASRAVGLVFVAKLVCQVLPPEPESASAIAVGPSCSHASLGGFACHPRGYQP